MTNRYFAKILALVSFYILLIKICVPYLILAAPLSVSSWQRVS